MQVITLELRPPVFQLLCVSIPTRAISRSNVSQVNTSHAAARHVISREVAAVALSWVMLAPARSLARDQSL